MTLKEALKNWETKVVRKEIAVRLGPDSDQTTDSYQRQLADLDDQTFAAARQVEEQGGTVIYGPDYAKVISEKQDLIDEIVAASEEARLDPDWDRIEEYGPACDGNINELGEPCDCVVADETVAE